MGIAGAEEPLSTQIVPGERITRVSTALNHISIVQFSEPIVSAAIGSEAVRMEYYDNRVLIQPLKAGVDTNLFVWTENFRRTYEILPAGDVATMSYLVDEVVPPPPPPPPGPSPEQLRKHTDEMFANVLMRTRAIDTRKIKSSHEVTIRVKEISEDARSYYIHLSAANRDARPYRLMEPSISAIHPAFAANAPAQYMNTQCHGSYSGHSGHTRPPQSKLTAQLSRFATCVRASRQTGLLRSQNRAQSRAFICLRSRPPSRPARTPSGRFRP